MVPGNILPQYHKKQAMIFAPLSPIFTNTREIRLNLPPLSFRLVVDLLNNRKIRLEHERLSDSGATSCAIILPYTILTHTHSPAVYRRFAANAGWHPESRTLNMECCCCCCSYFALLTRFIFFFAATRTGYPKKKKRTKKTQRNYEQHSSEMFHYSYDILRGTGLSSTIVFFSTWVSPVADYAPRGLGTHSPVRI